VVKIEFMVFCIFEPCCVVLGYQRFGEPCCLHHQDNRKDGGSMVLHHTTRYKNPENHEFSLRENTTYKLIINDLSGALFL
jgi:hypothetical protein